MDMLSKLFGSTSKVKLMRLFLLSPEGVFEREVIRKQSRIGASTLRSELNLLLKIGFLEEAFMADSSEGLKRKKSSRTKQKKKGFRLKMDFPFLGQLRSILISTETIEQDVLAKKLSNAGRMKLIVVSGIFIGESDSRVDLFIVGEKIKKNLLTNAIHELEAQIGRELVYAVLGTKEYKYRLQVHDRLVRDIFDYPHEVLVEKTL